MSECDFDACKSRQGNRMENRLAELEAKISFSEDLLESLNRTVYQQQQQIDRLQLELRALREQVNDSLPADASGPREELPPHY
jgi:SlyX protein